MKNNPMKTAAYPIFIIFLFLSSFTFLSYQYPVTADLWYFFGGSNDSPISFYEHTYFFGNPRIGELLLYFGGNTHTNIAIANLVSLIVFLCSAYSCATGRIYPALTLRDLIVFLAPLVFIAWTLPSSGTMFFYLPFSANYVFGLGLLLTFCAALRFSVERNSKAAIFALPPLGFIAGLSNEHTVPAVIGIIFLMLIYAIFSCRRIVQTLAIGLVFLAAGYALLFFAPGQKIRYAVDKYAQLTQPFKDIIERVFLMLGELLTNAWPIILFIILLSLFVRKRGFSRFGWFVVIASMLVAMGITATIAASPEVGPRLFFASYAFLTVGAIALLDFALRTNELYVRAVAIATISTLAAYFWIGYYWINQAATEYEVRKQIALEQAAKGIDPVVIPPSAIDYSKANFFIFPDVAFESTDPESVRNIQFARRLGVNRIVIGK